MAIGTPYLVAQTAVASGTGTSTSPFTVTVGTGGGVANTATDLLAAWVTWNSSSNNLLSLSDPVNNAWTLIGQPAVNGTNLGQWFIFPAAAALTTSQAFTITFSANSGAKTLQVWGISGLAGAPIDRTPVPATGSSTAPSQATGALSAASEIALAGLVSAGGAGAPTWPNSPFAILAGADQRNASNQYASAGYAIVSSAASVTATASLPSSGIWAVSLLTLTAVGFPMQYDAAGAADSVKAHVHLSTADVAGAADASVTSAMAPLGDVAGAAEAVVPVAAVPLPDPAGATDSFAITLVGGREQDYAGATDSISVVATETITFTPAAAAPTAPPEKALQYIPGVPVFELPAGQVFYTSAMPRLYLQNILTGQWMHRDVQGITQPSVGWQLDAAGTFGCTLTPPRADMLDATGNPLPLIWQTAGYLEEGDEIKWGGILTGSDPQGPNLALTFTEFTGYAVGMIYEGPNVSKTNYEALDAVRALWAWIQSQPNGNIGLVLDSTETGFLLGADPQFGTQTLLAKAANPGDKTITIEELPKPVPAPPPTPPGSPPPPPAWTVGAKLQVGSEVHTVASSTNKTITLKDRIVAYQPNNSLVALINPPNPYTLSWWNSTDCGQEIASIMAEAVFDFREVHSWSTPAKLAVNHRLMFGVPRIGIRQSTLRFAEGENIAVAGTTKQDGSTYANNIIGIGAGSGSATVRATSAIVGSQLRRTFVYTNQTATRPDRLEALTDKVLNALSNPDVITQIIVRDHPNAPFGSFGTGDDILVQLATGWRSVAIWSRIIAIQQDPTTRLMTLTLARSDSFTYAAASGTAGSI